MIFLGSTSKAMADREKRGDDRNMKIWISWEQRAFFIVFEGLSFGEK